MAEALSLTAAALVMTATIPAVIPGWYIHLEPALLAGTYGQDVTSLLLVPVLCWAMRATRVGSLRGPVVWLAILGFWAYGYALYAFGPTVTPVFPVYIAILGTSVYALAALVLSQDTRVYADRLSGTPRWPAVATLCLTVGLLAPVWFIQMFAGIAAGALPPTAGVLAIDLGLVFPAMVTAIVGLARRRAWAWTLALPLVVLAAVMLWSLVVCDTLAVVARLAGDPWPLTVVFATLATVATVAAVVSLRPLSREDGDILATDTEAHLTSG